MRQSRRKQRNFSSVISWKHFPSRPPSHLPVSSFEFTKPTTSTCPASAQKKAENSQAKSSPGTTNQAPNPTLHQHLFSLYEACNAYPEGSSSNLMIPLLTLITKLEIRFPTCKTPQTPRTDASRLLPSTTREIPRRARLLRVRSHHVECEKRYTGTCQLRPVPRDAVVLGKISEEAEDTSEDPRAVV